MRFAFWESSPSLPYSLSVSGYVRFPARCATDPNTVLACYFFAYVVDPVVQLLQKLLRGRIGAIIDFYLVFLGAVTVVCIFLGPVVVDEGRSLLTNLPALVIAWHRASSSSPGDMIKAGIEPVRNKVSISS